MTRFSVDDSTEHFACPLHVVHGGFGKTSCAPLGFIRVTMRHEGAAFDMTG